MAAKSTASNPAEGLDADVARGIKKSSLTVKRLAGDKASVRADFHFRGLRYQMDGVVDLAKGRAEPFIHHLSSRDGTVFEATVLGGRQDSRIEIQFGKALQAPRELVLNVEPLREGVLIGGFADGAELLPRRASGCVCDTADDSPLRPLLAWQADGATRPITMTVPKSVRQDLRGLAHVVQATVARMSQGIGVGDIFDVLNRVFCEIGCVGALLWCWIRQPDIPGTDGVFDILCMVAWGACNMVCRVNRPF